MGKVSNQEIVRQFQARLAELLRATEASRVTLRLHHTERGFHVDDVVAEVRREVSPPSRARQPSIRVEHRRLSGSIANAAP